MEGIHSGLNLKIEMVPWLVGVLTGDGETGNFNGVGNSPSVWRV